VPRGSPTWGRGRDEASHAGTHPQTVHPLAEHAGGIGVILEQFALLTEADEERFVFLRITWLKNCDAALRSISIKLRWLPLTSISRPIVSGRSVSRAKVLDFLLLAVLKDGEIVLFPGGHQAAPLVAHAGQNVDHVHIHLDGGRFVGRRRSLGGVCAHTRQPVSELGGFACRYNGVDVSRSPSVSRCRKPSPPPKVRPGAGRHYRRVGDYRIEFRDPDFETWLNPSFTAVERAGGKRDFCRLASAAGGKITPANILKLRPARMRAVGLSGQKTEYIRDWRGIRAMGGSLEELPELTDEE